MRCGGFGDMVLLSVLIQQLHARFAAPVDVITSGAWSPALLAAQTGVGEVFVVRSRKMPYWMSSTQQSLVRSLRKRGPGPAWFADPWEAGRDLLRRGDIPDALVCDYRDLPEIAGEHFPDRWVRFAALTPSGGRNCPPALLQPVTRDARLTIDHLRPGLQPWFAKHGLAGRNYIVIQAGNKRTMRLPTYRRTTNTKYWPEAHWAQVMRSIRSELPDHAFLLLGVRNERRLNAQIAHTAGLGDVHNVAGVLPVEILLPLLERAHSMVTVDTGPAHAAAALGCPTVTLFGRADSALYRPGGVSTPARVLTGRVDGELDINGITPDNVIKAWSELVPARGGRRLSS
jgi:ADP-heptose:LPS heptosyltransferase